MTTTSDDHDFPYYRSPESIRTETFNRRMRGLDEDEVNEYLDLLADQVEVSDKGLREARAENDRLERELQNLRAEQADGGAPEDRVNEQVLQLFSQAQLVAEEMVEDVSRDARQRLGQARTQERQILEEARLTAERTLRDAEAMLTRQAPGTSIGTSSSLAAPSGEVERVRSLARAAQENLQSIMDTFAAQVAQLGDSGLPAQHQNGSSSHGQDRWGSA